MRVLFDQLSRTHSIGRELEIDDYKRAGAFGFDHGHHEILPFCAF
jgi:hypothetical protein